jgi:hypothetical protein
MDGTVTSYNSGTGALVVNVLSIGGSGTFTSWSVRVSSGGAGGAQTQTTTVTLTSASQCVQVLNMPAFGHSVQLPSATTLSRGPDLFILDNSWGRFPVGVLDGAGRVLGAVLPGDAVDFDLIDNTTTAGSWRHRGNLDPVWVNFDAGLNLTLGSSGLGSSYSIDATRGLITYRNASNFPCARLVTYSGSGSPTISAELVLQAVNTNISSVDLLGSTNRLVVVFGNNTVACVDISNSSTLSVGTAVSLTWTGGFLHTTRVLDNQYVVAIGSDTSVVRARCIDCGSSGTTVTIGTEVATSSISNYSQIWRTKTSSSTSVGVMALTVSSNIYSVATFTVTRTSGTTLSWSGNAGAPTGIRTDLAGDLSWQFFDLSSDRLLFCYRANGGGPRYVVITFMTTPTYGTVASGNISRYDGSLNVSASPDRTRFVSFYSGVSGVVNQQCEAFTVSGTTVTVGSATNFTADTSIFNASTVEMAVDNNGRGFVTWASSYASTNSRDKWRTFTLSGTTFTFSTEVGRADALAGMQHNNTVSLSSRQDALGSGFFSATAFRFNSSGQISESRNIIFTINADTSINVLAVIECPGSSLSLLGIQGTEDRALSMASNNPGSNPDTEAIVFFKSGGFKRGRHVTGFNSLAFLANNRSMLLGINIDGQFGRNVTINTYRIAEA